MEAKTIHVFVQEEDLEIRNEIKEGILAKNYKLHFFPSDFSIFELLNFNPDIIIQDFKKNQIVNCLEWSSQY